MMCASVVSVELLLEQWFCKFDAITFFIVGKLGAMATSLLLGPMASWQAGRQAVR